jgi:hypothetical protein
MSPEQIFSLLMLIVAVLAAALSLQVCSPTGAVFALVLASLETMSVLRGSGRSCGADAKGTL